MTETSYLVGDLARDYVRDRGVPIGNNALKDHRSRGTGPRFAIINGRCLYTREWLDLWIEEEAARPVQRVKRGRRSRQQQPTA